MDVTSVAAYPRPYSQPFTYRGYRARLHECQLRSAQRILLNDLNGEGFRIAKLAAAETRDLRADLGEGRVLAHSPQRWCYGVTSAQAVPGHERQLPVGVGAWGGARDCLHRSKVSMMNMRPPQQGQGGR